MLRRAKAAIGKAKKTACLVISETTPLDIVKVLKNGNTTLKVFPLPSDKNQIVALTTQLDVVEGHVT